MCTSYVGSHCGSFGAKKTKIDRQDAELFWDYSLNFN